MVWILKVKIHYGMDQGLKIHYGMDLKSKNSLWYGFKGEKD